MLVGPSLEANLRLKHCGCSKRTPRPGVTLGHEAGEIIDNRHGNWGRKLRWMLKHVRVLGFGLGGGG